MKRVCVFAGSAPGARTEYGTAAAALGRALAARGMGLVYGGARVGLMGILADAVLQVGGEAIGIIPHALVAREVAHAGLTTLHVVETMHERKALMADLADAFIALPGGWGTLDELFEILTWAQLGLHRKPCGLLNVGEFYTPLALFIDQAVTEGFIKPVHRAAIVVDSDPERLLDSLGTVELPAVPKWIQKDET